MLVALICSLLTDSAFGMKDEDVKTDSYLSLDFHVIATDHNTQLTLGVAGLSTPRLLMDRERRSSTANPSTAASPTAGQRGWQDGILTQRGGRYYD